MEEAFSSIKYGRRFSGSDCIEVRSLIAVVLTVM